MNKALGVTLVVIGCGNRCGAAFHGLLISR